MTKKKYLTTIEDIEALRNTDTKIYPKDSSGIHYFKFINGVLCAFTINNELFMYNAGLSWVIKAYYILEEEPVKDADENDIGKLCIFWDDGFAGKMYGILEDYGEDAQTKRLSYYCKDARWYDNCRRLTPAEVAEITGYKVEE